MPSASSIGIRAGIVGMMIFMLVSASYVTLSALSLRSLNSLSGIQSGAEGDQNYVYGFQPPNTNTIYGLNDNSMSGYKFINGQYSGCYDSWNSGSAIYSATVQMTCRVGAQVLGASEATIWTSASVTSNIPQQATNAFGGFNLVGVQSGQDINWFTIPTSNGQKTHVYGKVMQSTFVMEFKPNGDRNLAFYNHAFWFQNGINIWGAQMCDPTNSTKCQNGYVWGAPLQAVITDVKRIYCNDAKCDSTSSGVPNNDQLNPMSQGSALSLYNQVTNSAPVGNPLAYSITSSNLQNMFQQYLQNGGSPQSPDPRIYQNVFYPIALTNFGPFGCGGFYGVNQNTCYPDVVLTVTLYYLVIGNFIWTNPNKTPYVPTPQNPSGCTIQNGCDTIGAWLSNPWNLAIASVIGGIILVVAVIAVLAVAAPSLFAFLIFGRMRNKYGGNR